MTPSELLLGHWYCVHTLEGGGTETVHKYFYNDNTYRNYMIEKNVLSEPKEYDTIKESINKRNITFNELTLLLNEYEWKNEFIFSKDGNTAQYDIWLDSREDADYTIYYFVDDNTVEKSQTFLSLSGLDKLNANREFQNGLLNIDWGTTSQISKQLLLERENVSYTEEKDEVLSFIGGTLAGFEVGMWMLFFNNDKLYEARMGIDISLEAQAISTYNEIKSLLKKKYGYPDVDVEKYSYPYEKGDGHDETAIKLGKATIGANWELEKTTIEIRIMSSLDIMLRYTSNKLSKEAEEKIEQKKIDEF